MKSESIQITGEVIRLGQLLKLADVVGSGGEIRAYLAEAGDALKVNGEPEARRGRQLRDGDVVEAGGRVLRIVAGG